MTRQSQCMVCRSRLRGQDPRAAGVSHPVQQRYPRCPASRPSPAQPPSGLSASPPLRPFLASSRLPPVRTPAPTQCNHVPAPWLVPSRGTLHTGTQGCACPSLGSEPSKSMIHFSSINQAEGTDASPGYRSGPREVATAQLASQ